MKNLKVQRYVWHEIISIGSLIKVKFKVTPIERQSL